MCASGGGMVSGAVVLAAIGRTGRDTIARGPWKRNEAFVIM